MALKIGGLNNNGATPLTLQPLQQKPVSGIQTMGSIGASQPTAQKSGGLSTTLVGGKQPSNPLALGSNQGMLPAKETPGQVKSTTDTSGKVTNYETKSNPSVLAQQKALNALGAGLVEDGIIGPKTRDAIAKYANQSGATPPAPTPAPSPTPKVETPPLTVAGQAPGLLNTGQQTSQEKQTFQGLIGQSQNSSQEYKDAVAKYQQVAQQLEAMKSQAAQQTRDINTSGTWTSRALGEQGQANLQNSATEAALSGELESLAQIINAANTQQGLQVQAGTNANTAAQNQAQRASAVGSTVLDAVSPVYGVQYGTQTGQPGLANGGLDSGAYGSGPAAAANVESIKDLTGQVNQIQSIFNGAEANFKLLVDTAKQGGVIDTSIPAINALQQSVAKGLTSSSAVINFQNTLAAVRSQYAQILGGGTTTVDSQNRAEQAIPPTISLQALESLEQQLKSEATNRVQGMREQISQLEGSSGGSSGGNMFGSFF